MKRKKVVIIGGGFGGLTAAKSLKKANVDITLIDKTNHHLFQPLLYQVATAALSPGDISAPIRGILRNQTNVEVVMGEVSRINRDKKTINLKLNNDEIRYDYLVVATGARHSYFGNDEWENYAPGLKTLSDALNLRERILLSFERAERYYDTEPVEKYLTFVVVGAGPTGVEMAGAIAEISKKTMLTDFRKIDPAKTKILLVEGADRVLTPYSPELSEKAKQSLESMGVTILTGKRVTNITDKGVQIDEDFIETPNIIWAAGNKASGLLKELDTGLDNSGRVIVENDCSLQNDENVFVIGDAAHFSRENTPPVPAVAPAAVQQGKYVAKIIAKAIKKEKRKPFVYVDKGNMATIGRNKAILEVGKIGFSGFIAWLAWSFVHILFLIGFRNKYKVMVEWIWYYLSVKHGIRLITNKTDL
ncbi:MAG: NAD(P)/FAD-dependent oxidoreductase [Rhodothermaceae bacterium]